MWRKRLAETGPTQADDVPVALAVALPEPWVPGAEGCVPLLEAGVPGASGVTTVAPPPAGGFGASGVLGAEGVLGVLGAEGVLGADGVLGVLGAEGVAGAFGLFGSEGLLGVVGADGGLLWLPRRAVACALAFAVAKNATSVWLEASSSARTVAAVPAAKRELSCH